MAAASTKFIELVAAHQRLLLQFVTVELDLAETFCARAASARPPQEKAGVPSDKTVIVRNINNARKAYESAIHAMKRSGQNPRKHPDIATRMRKVERLLNTLPLPS
jgi:hypothetical protein